jgi:hypothetical protein
MRLATSFLGAMLALALLPPPAAALSREQAAEWLSAQLETAIEPAQLLAWPEAPGLDGCRITRLRAAATGGMALSLRCPAMRLPHSILLRLAPEQAQAVLHSPAAALRTVSAQRALAAARVQPLVRSGAAVRALWQGGALRFRLPVIALDSGAAGAEIRVRNPIGGPALRARIVSAGEVLLLAPGA